MDACYSHAIRFRAKALALADRAFKTPSDILDDPEASPSVRLKAATFIIQTAIAPPPYKPEEPCGVEELPWNVVLGKNGILAQQKREKAEMEREEEEQEEMERQQKQSSQPAAQKPENLHKNAHPQQPRRNGPSGTAA
ncbi:MAG: hypothetical protein ABSH49_00410 [Bryobacteraceae bacterium]|jgi:hypothetical protein